MSFDAAIASDVPLGGGLSSSAALEVSVATLIQEITRVEVSGVDKALRQARCIPDTGNMHDNARPQTGFQAGFLDNRHSASKRKRRVYKAKKIAVYVRPPMFGDD